MPKPKIYTRSICFELDEGTYKKLAELSQELLMPKSMLIRIALREYLKKYEAGLDVRPGSVEG